MKKYSLEIVHSFIFLILLCMISITKLEYSPASLEWVSTNALVVGFIMIIGELIYLLFKGKD